jgi:hypothetical protein
VLPGAAIGLFAMFAVTTSVTCSLRHDASHLGFGGPEPCLPSQDITPTHDEDAWGWILEGMNNVENMLENIFDGRRMCM